MLNQQVIQENKRETDFLATNSCYFFTNAKIGGFMFKGFESFQAIVCALMVFYSQYAERQLTFEQLAKHNFVQLVSDLVSEFFCLPGHACVKCVINKFEWTKTLAWICLR